MKEERALSPRALAWRRFARNRGALAGSIWIVIVCLSALFAPALSLDRTTDAARQLSQAGGLGAGEKVWVKPVITKVESKHNTYSLPWQTREDDNAYLPAQATDSGAIQLTYLLGSDRFGRDLLSRLLLGSRISLGAGFTAVLISLLLGVIIGSLTGYFGGWVDRLGRWLMSVVWSVPSLLLVMALSLALGRGIFQVYLAIGLTMWVEVARQVRGGMIASRQLGYVEAARALGYPSGRILRIHLLPNLMGPVMVVCAGNFAGAVLLEAGLSFLGLGVSPPTPSWGSMVSDGYAYLFVGQPLVALVPAIAISLLVMSVNLVGSGLRDALDVKD